MTILRSRPVVILLLVVATGMLLSAFLFLRSAPVSRLQPAQSVARGEYNPPRSVSDFALTDQDGRPMKLSDLRNKPVWMFFGYTHCPDVCPLTMAMMKKVKGDLGDAGARVAFVFISVDGKRDTPPVVKQFVTSFDPRFIGLTGDEQTVRRIATEFSAQFDAADAQDSTGTMSHAAHDTSYIVNHTRYSYALDKQGRWRFVYLSDTPMETIEQDLLRLSNE